MQRRAIARLKSHINASPHFYAMKSAYRAFLSTETVLVKIVDKILESVDSGFIVALVNLDISAAVDTVNHVTLLAMVQSEFGITENQLSWIELHLSGR